MSEIILLKDKDNFFTDDILGRLIKLSDLESWPYKKFFIKNNKELSGKVFYLTPISTNLIPSLRGFIENNKINTINPFSLQIADKPAIDNIFLELGIPHPPGIITDDCLVAQEFIKKHRTAIVKSVNDCGGSGHFIVRENLAYLQDKKYFLNFEDKKTGKREITMNNLHISPPFYIQKFLYPDDNCVWRAYVVGQEVKFFSVRKRENYRNIGDYVINVAKGAKYFLKEGENNLRALCNRFSETVSLDVGAIDIIFHKGRPYFLEVNCEGVWMLICRKFYECSNYNSQKHNFDRFIKDYLKGL